MVSRAYEALHQTTNEYVDESAKYLHSNNLLQLLNPLRLGQYIWDLLYILVQIIIVTLFKAPPPKAPTALANPHGRIAVIGAGITGVSSAAHAISHGFEVVIFEAGPSSSLGGIWSHVNSTSGLQLNSMLYRFHPAIIWSKAFPLRDEILGETRRIWRECHLDKRTRFETKVTSVRRAPPPKDASEWSNDPDRTRWIINDGEEGIFDAVIVTVGSCGEPNWVTLPGMPHDVGKEDKKSKKKHKHTAPTQDTQSLSGSNDSDAKQPTQPGEKHPGPSDDLFKKTIIHSSQLDSPSFKLKGGERVVVIGSGASGVEAVETVLAKFGSVQDYKDQPSGDKETKRGVEVTMIARDDKWIIPRNIMIDTFIAGQPFGRQMPLSFLWEGFLRHWQYYGIDELVPKNLRIFEGTPVVNDVFLHDVRSGRCHYVRGQPVRLTGEGVIVEARKPKPGSSKSSSQDPSKGKRSVEEIPQGEEKLFHADVIVLATGFKKPTIDFLPQDLFPEGYQRPDLYLQNFSTEDWSILMTNSAYINAIGTVGHFHIGIYTRILLTLLLDPGARPAQRDMKLWVDVLRFIKRGATGGALGFFTYMELTIWLLGFHLFRPDRLKWLFFIMNGWGVYGKN
ncbi:hypothetical protein GALMADRAFT_252072 [Galerina marginata CBS 339.88]|uniref:FAD/NAD(P)-binding domain-containing protein n=1 Tax=Galerina marginata (strain CBS 339.88) TaxID=685588 RepID=A0A067T197_GALM3|nr:hypothetical protein GALMADRAFT_252072 [Galerina marginata CBS 339.88]